MDSTTLSLYSSRPAQWQRGLSLIELMISIAIGLIMLAALTTLFVNQSQIRTELDKSGRLIENGRYALEVLAEDLQLAGYYGELNPTGIDVPTPAATIPPNPCTGTNLTAVTADLATAIPLHIQGYNNATNIPSAARPTCVPDIVAGTDILVMRRAETSVTAVTAVAVATVATPHLQISLCNEDPIPVYKVDIIKASFNLHQKTCTKAIGSVVVAGPFSDLRRFLVHIYFIAPNNAGADGIPTLKRVEMAADGTTVITPLVEGVQNMQIDYGLDNDGNGTVDAWTACAGCTNQQWADVIAVRVHLLARSQETTPGYDDGGKTYTLGINGAVGPFADAYKRRAYSEFIRITNPAGRRE